MKLRTYLRPDPGSLARAALTKPPLRAHSAMAHARFKALFGYLCRHRKYVIVASIVLLPGGLVCPAAIWLHRRFKRPAEGAETAAS